MSETRPIRFRAWHKAEKRMFDVYDLSWFSGIFLIGDEQSWDRGKYGSGEVVVMQFTGLKDSKGKDIYEGDILSCSYDKPITLRDEHVWPHEEFIVTPEERKCEVYWSDGSFKLFDHGKHDWMLLGVANVKEMAILGNIYENAHLVPQEKIRRHLKMIY